MAALTLANMLSRVKRIVPTTTLDTELQDHLLERMNYLASMDVFPFQEEYQSETITAGSYYWATPDNFATVRSLVIWTEDSQRPLEKMDAKAFDAMFPNPSALSAEDPVYYCIKVAEGQIYFNCPFEENREVRMYYYAIPDDVTDTTISQMTELAKLTCIHWAASDGFADMKEYDRSEKQEGIGNKHFATLKRRYQLSIEEDARFVSPKEAFLKYKGY